MLESGFDLARLAEDFRPLHLLLGRVYRDVRLVRVVEEREHPVVLFLLQRIELVVVTLGALDGDAEDSFSDGVYAVKHGFHPKLLGIDAALFVDHRVAQKPRGDDLTLGRVRQHVAGNLFDDELVVRYVAVQSADNPVPVKPDLALLVFLVAVGVGVAGRIQPQAAPALAVVGRTEKPLDLLLVSVLASVGEKGIHLLG